MKIESTVRSAQFTSQVLTLGSVMVGCLLALSATSSLAEPDDLPLSLTLTGDVTHDSNFSRNDAKLSETIKTGTAKVLLNKAYGRQNYNLNASVSAQRYARYGQLLDNDGKNVAGSFSTGLASNWTVTTGGTYAQNLNPIQNNLATNRVVRNIRTYRDGNLAVQYGNGGRFALVGTLDANKTGYSDSAFRTLNNVNQDSKGLRILYFSSDLLNFGLGARQVVSRYPESLTQERQTDHNIDLTSSWQVTGLSNFNAQISRRNSRFASDDTRQVKGYTGSLDWSYTPRGLMSYGVGLSRNTGADRRTDSVVDSQTNLVFASRDSQANSIYNTANFTAAMQATAKIMLRAGYTVTRYSYDRSVADQSVQASSLNQTLNFSVNYALLRSVASACSIQRYKQTADETRPKFDGQTIGCSVSVTLD
jgi:hypothetical protein